MTEESDIPYEERELIQRAINGASGQHAAAVARGEHQPLPRWAIVKRLFCCGSTISNLICYRYGFDAERMIGENSPESVQPTHADGF